MRKDPLADLVEINRRMFEARDRLLDGQGYACRHCGITVMTYWSVTELAQLPESKKLCTSCKGRQGIVVKGK
jgi:hypothetical protein